MSETTSTEERWLPVVGYEGMYDVSDKGRVWSRPRQIVRSNGRPFAREGRYLRPTVDSGGYPGVKLSGKLGQRTVRVHSLILTAFVGPCPPGHEACHGNGVRTDSRLANLRWGTHTENMADLVRHGTHATNKQTHCLRGHLLVEPNLCATRRGGRQCKACDNAQSIVKKWRGRLEIDMADEADRQYERIISGGPTEQGRSRVPRPRKTHCSRGHALIEPNLCGAARRCRACQNAKCTALYQMRANGVVIDRDAESDRQYTLIMGQMPRSCGSAPQN